MNEQSVAELARGALELALLVSAPVLIAALVVGLVIGVLQAMTQVNEVTLTFVPKMLAAALVLFLLGPWMLSTFLGYTVNLFSSLPTLAR